MSSEQLAVAVGKIEPGDKLLVALVVFFTLGMCVISKWSPNDGQTFQVLGGMATGSLAAFLTRMTGKKDQPPPEPPK